MYNNQLVYNVVIWMFFGISLWTETVALIILIKQNKVVQICWDVTIQTHVRVRVYWYKRNILTVIEDKVSNSKVTSTCFNLAALFLWILTLVTLKLLQKVSLRENGLVATVCVIGHSVVVVPSMASIQPADVGVSMDDTQLPPLAVDATSSRISVSHKSTSWVLYCSI